MTGETPQAVLCAHCGSRPATCDASLPDALRGLCEPCLQLEYDRRMSEAFRQWGSEVEVAMLEAGNPLPMPGEALVRSMFDDMRRQAESPEWQARVAPLRSALQQFTEELRVE